MDFVEAVRGRRSIRKFTSVRPEKQLIKQAVELAKWSSVDPTFRTWTYHVALSPQTVDRISSLANLNTAALSHFLEDVPAADLDSLVNRFGHVASAAAFIMVSQNQETSPKDEATTRTWFGMELQLLLLALHELGLGGSLNLTPPWIASELLGILDTDDDTLLALVAVGYPDEQPETPERPAAACLFY